LADFVIFNECPFAAIELFYGKKLQGVTTPGQQLELF
jgi:hypothetical protein